MSNGPNQGRENVLCIIANAPTVYWAIAAAAVVVVVLAVELNWYPTYRYSVSVIDCWNKDLPLYHCWSVHSNIDR